MAQAGFAASTLLRRLPGRPMSPPAQNLTAPTNYLHWIWASRASELTDAGEAGELLVARARLAFSALIFVVPLVSVMREPAKTENWVGLSAVAVSTVISAAVLAAVRHGWRPRWLGFATSLYDVTVISLVLASFFAVGPPYMAANSRVTFEIYFLAIATSALRYDRRVCLITGAAAALQYAIIVWVTVQRWPVGDAMTMMSPYGSFSAADQAGRIILLLVATVLSMTLVDRTERLRVLSTHDGLTSLYNRAYFDERLEEEVLRARRYKRPLSVVIADLDRFKDVNDHYGHIAGDAVLRRFAELLRDSVRRTDIVARYGGEEFAIILPETTVGGAVGKLAQLCAQMAESTIDLPGAGRRVRLTFSAGVAGMPGDGDHSENLISHADARLLHAKASGRKCVKGPAEPNG